MQHFFFLYIDPGSGSVIIQALIAGVLGVMFYIKGGIKKVKNFFGKKTKESEDNL